MNDKFRGIFYGQEGKYKEQGSGKRKSKIIFLGRMQDCSSINGVPHGRADTNFW